MKPMTEHVEGMKYYPDPIAAFNDGCLMDLRFRVAMQFCQAMITSAAALDTPAESIAHHALRTAESLFKQGVELGWIDDLPESSNLNAATKRHLERNVNCQMHQQKYVQAEQAGAIRPTMNG